MSEEKDKREFLTKEEAIEFVGGKRDLIHCFTNPVGILMGSDWDWDDFTQLLDKAEVIEKSGEQATNMKHPLAVYKDKWHFFEAIK